MPKRYAQGKFAVGECARSGRKMLLKDMVSDGYYPSLVVDPAWYEGKHPQESLPEIEDPVSLWRPAPERDLIGATIQFDQIPVGNDGIVGGGTGEVDDVSQAAQAGGDIPWGFGVGTVEFEVFPTAQHIWNMDSVVTPEPDVGAAVVAFDLGYTAAPVTGEPSLRTDATGNSIRFIGPSTVQSSDTPFIYGNGFTIECGHQPTVIGLRSIAGGDSRTVSYVGDTANTNRSVFMLGFDNWANPGAATDLFPYFVLLPTGTNYDTITDRSSILSESRGVVPMILNDIYHLLGTVSATGEVVLYVNGVEVASSTVNMTIFIESLNTSLLNGTRTQRDNIGMGARTIGGAKRSSAQGGESRIDNVRLYSSFFSPAEAAQAAAAINFTT